MSFLESLTKIFKKATALAAVVALAALLAHAQQTTPWRPLWGGQ